jgi:hypothetical protein
LFLNVQEGLVVAPELGLEPLEFIGIGLSNPLPPKAPSITKQKPYNEERAARGDPFLVKLFGKVSSLRLQSGFDFKTPSFEQGLRNVLGILVPACPFAQPGRAQILVRGKFVFVHNLLEFGYRRSDWADRLRLAPIGVSASFGHEKYTLRGDTDSPYFQIV